MQIRTLLAIVATGIVAIQAVAVPADDTYEMVSRDVDHCVAHNKLDDSDWSDIEEMEEEFREDGEFDRRSSLGKHYESKGTVFKVGTEFFCKWRYASEGGWCEDETKCDEQDANLVQEGDDCKYQLGTGDCEC